MRTNNCRQEAGRRPFLARWTWNIVLLGRIGASVSMPRRPGVQGDLHYQLSTCTRRSISSRKSSVGWADAGAHGLTGISDRSESVVEKLSDRLARHEFEVRWLGHRDRIDTRHIRHQGDYIWCSERLEHGVDHPEQVVNVEPRSWCFLGQNPVRLSKKVQSEAHKGRCRRG